MSEIEARGMSAAQARRQIKRAKAPRERSAPRQFTIHREGQVVLDHGTLKDVRALLPKVKASLLTRRLDGGERDYDRLARPPESPASRKKKLNPVPMYRRKT